MALGFLRISTLCAHISWQKSPLPVKEFYFYFFQVKKCCCYYTRDCVVHKLLITHCYFFVTVKQERQNGTTTWCKLYTVFHLFKEGFVIRWPKGRVLLLVSFHAGSFPWLEGVFECSLFSLQVSSLLTLCVKCIFDHKLD